MTRYNRQMRLPEVGAAGQQTLSESTVVIVGVGGLGAPAALYLAAAGVGTLRLVDFDRVDASNLHRQVLYAESDVGRPKVVAARERLLERNRDIAVEIVDAPFSADNASEILSDTDLVLDGTDAFSTRYLVNDAARLHSVPNVFASVSSFDCQLFVSADGPCYRCLFPEPPPSEVAPSCAEAGVLGVVPGVAGILQATEALKVLLGIGDNLSSRFLLIDLLGMRFREIGIERDPACSLCGDTPTIRSLDGSVRATEATCGPLVVPTRTVAQVQAQVNLSAMPVFLDVRTPEEYLSGALPNSLSIPLADLESRAGEIPADREVIVYCHSGIRSRQATSLLRRHGVDAYSLDGGIVAWQTETDALAV
ncbi:MAG: ThiF family adenylyltransferase [Bacteroidota bacterium]